MKTAVGRSGGRTAGVMVGVLVVLTAGSLAPLGAHRLTAQEFRASVWGTYEAVEERDDWSAVVGQLHAVWSRGDRAWLAAEGLGRFGTSDVALRLGGVLHPAPRWWLTLEAAGAPDADFTPEYALEGDVTARLGRRAAVGLGYRYQEYVVGTVQVLMPHLRVDLARTAWDARVFISRNPTDRTDVAFMGRVTATLGRRGAAWVGAGAGRESYFSGVTIEALETVTGLAGIRYVMGARTAVRAEIARVQSRTVLSRWGVTVGLDVIGEDVVH